MSKNKKKNDNTVEIPVSYDDFMEKYLIRLKQYIDKYEANYPGKKADYKRAHRYAKGNLIQDLMGLGVNIKVISYPLMSNSASGTNNEMIFSHSINKKPYVNKYKIPKDTKTPRKNQVNNEFKIAAQAWKIESESTRNLWRKFSKDKPQTGHSLYTQKYLRLLRHGSGIPHPLLP